MNRITADQERLRRASGLAELLDAAYGAFEHMLSVIRACEDPAGPLFVPFVMAAASAADGRDAIGFAPALPRYPLLPDGSSHDSAPASMEAAADALANLSELLAAQLEAAAGTAVDPADQAACRNAARHARDVHGLLTGRPL
jgi:hypothetical protein